MTSIRAEIRRLTVEGAPLSCSVTVASVTPVSDSFLRVAVVSEELEAYKAPLPADAFKILLPPDGTGAVDFPRRGSNGLPFWPDGARQPALRAFSVRRINPTEPRIEFDVLQHPGLATSWLGQVQTGDVIGLAGMRRDFVAAPGVDQHLIIGDSSALPATAAIVESLTSRIPATVYLAVEHDSDRDLVPQREHVTVHWVGGGGSPVGPGSALEEAVRQYEKRQGRTQAWMAAEASVVRELRHFVLGELEVTRDDLQAAAYWKAGSNSTQVDTANLGRYQREIADGCDAADPDVRERVELHL